MYSTINIVLCNSRLDCELFSDTSLEVISVKQDAIILWKSRTIKRPHFHNLKLKLKAIGLEIHQGYKVSVLFSSQTTPHFRLICLEWCSSKDSVKMDNNPCSPFITCKIDQARRLSGAVQIFLGGGKKATMKVTMLSVVIIIQSNDFLVLSPLYTILDCVYSI